MKLKKLVAAIAVTLFSSGSIGANAVLENLYVRAGVNEITGTMGSGGNTSPGLLYDSTGTGTFNTGYDYLTPGSPFEGFTVKVDGTQYRNNNAGNQAQITGAWTGTPTSSSAVWDGGVTGVFGLRNTYSLPSGQQYIGIQTRITVTNPVAALYFARYIDPDARAAAGDSSVTDNVRGYSGIPATNVIFSEALASRYALGLYSSQVGGVNTGPSNTWSTDPSTYYTGGSYTVGQGDHTIGIAFYSSGLSAGDIVTYNYAYIFGPNAFGAATTATSAYDPGATFTVTNVGSATTAASASSTPTVTGTSTATITVSDTTVVNTALPVITGSVAHHTASEVVGVQTIARETTTTVTTPMRRDVTTLVRTTSTWSDSTTTTSDSATSTATTLSNSVTTTVANDSFSGRIDQMTVLSKLNDGLDRKLDMIAFRNDGIATENGRMYVNGGSAKSTGTNDYTGTVRLFGIGSEVNVNRDWAVGVQFNKVDTTLNGVDSTTSQDKTHVGMFSMLDIEGAMLVNNIGYAQNNIKSNRTIRGIDFNNNHATQGNNIWTSARLYSSSIEGFRPFVGGRIGRVATKSYTEAGSIQSARSVERQASDYKYGEAGVRYDTVIDDFIAGVELTTTTDQFKTAEVSLAYNVNKDSVVAVTGSRQVNSAVSTNLINLSLVVRF